MTESSLGEQAPAGSRPLAFIRERRLEAPLVLAGLIAIAFVARLLMSRHVLAPWVMEDELQYSEMAKSFAAGGHYLFRDHPYHVATIYPALISPAWLAHSLSTTYALAKAINVVLMTAAAIPLYLWARRLVPAVWALVTVALFLALPSFVYTDELLTENAYLPAVVLALFGISLALERPTIRRQIAALALCALAAAVRVQGLVFLLVLPTAVVLKVGFDLVPAPGGRLAFARAEAKRWWPTAAALVAGVVAYAAYKATQGRSLSSGLGVYSSVTGAHYTVREASRWIVYHFAELALSVGVLPFSALIVLFGLAWRRASAPSNAERAFLAATAAGVFWTVVEVGVFASQYGFRIEERYLFNLAPVLLLALTVWLARGLPRPPALTAVAVLIPAALLVALPFEAFFTQALYNDTFGLIPLFRLTQRLGNVSETKELVAAGALLAGLLFAAVPRRVTLVAAPVALLAFFALSTNSVFGIVEFLSSQTRHAGGLQGNPSWIDRTVGRDARVELLWTPDIADAHVGWQAEFWNRSVRRVFGVTAQDPDIPDVSAPLQTDGRIVPSLVAGSPDLSPRYVVAPATLDVDGTRLAASGQLALWRVRPPLRLSSLTSGVTPDGWTGPTAVYTRYVVPRDAKQVVVAMSRTGLPNLPAAHVVATVAAPGGAIAWEVRRVTVPGGGGAVLRLPLRRGPFRVVLMVSPTFSPAQFGSSDARTLGVRASFKVG